MRSSHQNLKQEALRDPDTKKYYESLEEEFSILEEFIRERKKEMLHMQMHNPPHPGEILKELYLDPLHLTVTETAFGLKCDA